MRLVWIHAWLPLWCLLNRVQALHKLATETPYWSPCARITTIHDFYHEFIEQTGHGAASNTSSYFKWITQVALRKSRHIITGSETIAADIRQRGADGPPITVVHHGVSYGGVQFREISSSMRTILCVAKLMPYKGQMQALEAFSSFCQNYPQLSRNLRLRLHGFANDPQYAEALDHRMSQADVNGFVERSSYNPEASLDQIYADATAVLFLTAYEGFGLPVIEAQARGLPVICSDIPVLHEVGGNSPWYVDRNDPNAIAHAIAAMMDNADERNRRVALGYENSKRFSWEKAAKETLQVYRQCSGLAGHDGNVCKLISSFVGPNSA